MSKTLSQLMPGLHATFSLVDNEWTLDTAKGGSWTQAIPTLGSVWTTVSPGLIASATIDLSGWQRLGEDVSLFPKGFSMQEPGLYFNNSSINQSLNVTDIISTTPFTDQQLVDAVAMNTAPSLPNAAGDWDRVMYGRVRVMSGITAGAGSPALANTMYTQYAALFGSGEPAASNILYCYRVIQPGLSDDGAVIIAPATRMIITGDFEEEAALVHLDRMYRSYNSR
jgi:hypothetical protein